MAPNVIPSQSGVEDRYLVEGEPETSLRIGAISLEAGTNAAMINDAVEQDTDYLNTGGLFDFEVRDLDIVCSTTLIVLPQQRPLPADAV